MPRLVIIFAQLAALCVLPPLFPPDLYALQYGGLLVSEHVRVKIPVERQWLGRDAIADLEKCWSYVNGALDGKLPRRVLVEVIWEGQETSTNYRESSVLVGMAHPAAPGDMKSFLLHRSAMGMARLGLAELSRQGTLREENRFLVEGMCEIMAREFRQTTRGLAGAWVIAHFLERAKLLGFAPQSSWASFSGGREDLRAVAPGVTLLSTLRELHGRERTIKLFEAMKKESLEEALASTFKSPARVLEQLWLKKVREFQIPGDVTVTSESDAPTLLQTTVVSGAGRPGGKLQIRLSVQDAGRDFSAGSLFAVDEPSGRVIEGRVETGRRSILVEIPIERQRRPGKYNFRITAVDDSGNVRQWNGSYDVEA